jgi:hypothetical protein
MGQEGATNGGEERAGLADAPYDRWVLLRPAEGSSRPSARYKVRARARDFPLGLGCRFRILICSDPPVRAVAVSV